MIPVSPDGRRLQIRADHGRWKHGAWHGHGDGPPRGQPPLKLFRYYFEIICALIAYVGPGGCNFPCALALKIRCG